MMKMIIDFFNNNLFLKYFLNFIKEINILYIDKSFKKINHDMLTFPLLIPLNYPTT